MAPVRPSAALQAAYQARLDRMIAAMNRDTQRQVKATYRANPPEMAQDESSAAALRRLMAGLGRKWEARFNEFAQTWGRKFTRDAASATDRAFAANARKAGLTVRFQITRAMNDVMQATIGEQVSLIRSIPEEYLKDVEGSVMRSVQIGRDIGGLAAELEKNYGITRRRAETIARDQNNKATASMTRVRQQEIGITHAVWLHSAGGKQPRPSHVAFSGKQYEIARGAFLDGVWTWPGVEINCRCVPKSVLPWL
jgi:SPP1 gp7 family putative phage head morphogenesis protein